MLRLLIRKEIAEIIRSSKFAITYGVMATLILLAFFTGAANYRTGVEEYEAAQQEAMRQFEEVKSWDEVQYQVSMPPQPLHALVSGISNDIGRMAYISYYTFGAAAVTDSRFNSDTIYAVFRLVDLGFVFTVVLSLFAIMFAFDSVNGEKERGTLALAMSNSIPRDQFLLGKLIGTFCALCIPLLIPILAGCLILPLSGVPMEASAWGILAAIIVAGMLYVGVFLGLSVFVSSLVRRSATSFLFLLVAWIFLVLVVPRLSVMVAGGLIEIAPVDEVEQEKQAFARQTYDELNEKMREADSEIDRSALSEEASRRRSAEIFLDLKEEQQEQIDRFFTDVDERWRNAARRRENLSLAMARISPAAVFGVAATTLAGSSLELQRRFSDEVRAHQDRYQEFVRAELRAVDAAVWWGGNRQEMEDIDPTEMPRFEYREQAASDRFVKALPDLGLLVLINLVLFGAAVVSFRRFDVR